MRRLLAVIVTVLIAAGIVTATAASATSASSPNETLCIYPKSLTVGGHTVTTPEICIPVA